jgi:hypothetical protein
MRSPETPDDFRTFESRYRHIAISPIASGQAMVARLPFLNTH